MKISMFAGLSFVAFTFGSFAQELPGAPRLEGIVNLPNFKRAILEPFGAGNRSREAVVLAEAQRDEVIEVQSIHPEDGSVAIRVQGKSMTVRLPANSELEGAGIVLAEAELPIVLKLYEECAHRTGLRSPHLPAVSFNLSITVANQTDAARALEAALAAKQISTLRDGKKFVMVAPTSEIWAIRPKSAEIRASEPPGSPSTPSPEEFAAGTIDFRNADLSQVAAIYAELLGRKLERGQPLRRGGNIILHTQTTLTKAEALYALETLFRWQGLKMEPVGTDGVKVVPVPEN
jgi:hypothetical protein